MRSTHEFTSRAEQFRDSMAARGVDVAVLLDPRSQFYLTGIGLRGAVVVPAQGSPTHLVQLNVERASDESAIDDVRQSRGVSTVAEVVTEIVESNQTGSEHTDHQTDSEHTDHQTDSGHIETDVRGETDVTLGIETDVVPIELGERLQAELPPVSLENVAPLILDLRRRKSPSELERMEQAAAISRQTFDAVPEVFEEGMTELELQSKLQYVKRSAGAEVGMWSRAWDQHLEFGTLVSGPNTAVVSGHWVTMTGNGPSRAQPYGAGHREISNGDVVVVDHQTVYEGYHCDEARSYVVGDPTDRQRHIHEVLRETLTAAEDAIEPGNPVSDVYDAAFEVVSETPYAEGFMALDQVGFEYVGHGVGLNADEGPLLTPWEETPMEPGMAFAVEPKVLVEGEEGLTLEDTFVVTDDGSRRLTDTPRELYRL